jgi:hypothetical protein
MRTQRANDFLCLIRTFYDAQRASAQQASPLGYGF